MNRSGRFVVGLTGGIGAGKSSVLAELKRLGFPTISLDSIAREQARPGRRGYRAILRAFGRSILDAAGRIDRRLLGSIVFRDISARRRLERATHPPILREMRRRLGRRRGVVVVDVPLLFEGGLQNDFDATVLVSCPLKTRILRVARRDGLPVCEVRRRVSSQWPATRKRILADVTIANDRSLPELRARVKMLSALLALLYGGTPNGNAD